MLSVKQCADRLGVSAALVYALCAARRIRHERHGLGRGTIRVSQEALEEYRRSVSRRCELHTTESVRQGVEHGHDTD